MSVSSETIFKLTNAVESIVITDGDKLKRAQIALMALDGIDKTEFTDNVAGIPWNYISSIAKDIESGRAGAEEASKFVSSVWQLFNAYRPR